MCIHWPRPETNNKCQLIFHRVCNLKIGSYNRVFTTSCNLLILASLAWQSWSSSSSPQQHSFHHLVASTASFQLLRGISMSPIPLDVDYSSSWWPWYISFVQAALHCTSWGSVYTRAFLPRVLHITPFCWVLVIPAAEFREIVSMLAWWKARHNCRKVRVNLISTVQLAT